MRGEAEYLKSTMAFSSPVNSSLVEERAGAVNQAVILVAGVGVDALAVESREQRG